MSYCKPTKNEAKAQHARKNNRHKWEQCVSLCFCRMCVSDEKQVNRRGTSEGRRSSAQGHSQPQRLRCSGASVHPSERAPPAPPPTPSTAWGRTCEGSNRNFPAIQLKKKINCLLGVCIFFMPWKMTITYINIKVS